MDAFLLTISWEDKATGCICLFVLTLLNWLPLNLSFVCVLFMILPCLWLITAITLLHLESV